MYDAFTRAKAVALDLYRTGEVEMNIRTPVPWLTPLLARNARAFPDDGWPYGVAANRQVIETFSRYFFEQGLSTRRFKMEDIFAPALMGS